MALYDDLIAVDIITPILGTHKIQYTRNGDPVVLLQTSYKQTPWIHHREYLGRHCGVWHIYFGYYGIIPIGCRGCWKVVMEIPTLRQLLRVKEHQDDSKWNCKCGLETRPFTGGLGGYRGFWYAPMDGGLAGARAMLTDVQRDFPGVRLILKRGCTEFEVKYSPSSIWDRLAHEGGWDMKEELLNTLFMVQKMRHDQGTPSMMQPSVVRRWIEFGYEYSKTTGDTSYLEFIDAPPVPPVLTYQTGKYSDEDFGPRAYPKPIELEGLIDYEQPNHPRGSEPDESESEQDRDSGKKVVLLADLEASK